jgi:hypothetical protein
LRAKPPFEFSAGKAKLHKRQWRVGAEKASAADQIASGVGLAAKQAPSMMKEFCLLFFQKVRIITRNYA